MGILFASCHISRCRHTFRSTPYHVFEKSPYYSYLAHLLLHDSRVTTARSRSAVEPIDCQAKEGAKASS